MPFFILYLLKLSVSLAVVFLFYQFVLRKLTFYNWNRWYLLGYTLLSFLVSFIDISPVLEKNELVSNTMITWIPVFAAGTGNDHAGNTFFTGWGIAGLVMAAGSVFMLIRLLFQLLSFRKMRKKAGFVSNNGVSLYQVEEDIIPFSFGNSIFINRNLHTEAELQEIIRHEFVHVKQRHSVDIIWGELVCLLNWYNPFAWLLKGAIRQNLEFIADDKVIETGVCKKEYQYLLLKVIGNNQYSIANQFNFSSLKKRIAMMNKLKSAKVNLLRFLFILPLLAVILLSFRKQIGDTLSGKKEVAMVVKSVITDTVPAVHVPNEKGYYIDIVDSKGNCTLVVKDKNKNEVKRILLTKWNENKEYFENLYGELPPPPPPPPPPAPPVMTIDAVDQAPPAPPAPTALVKLPAHVSTVNINNEIATVILKDGTKEKYDLSIPAQRKSFESKYGKLPVPPPPPAPPAKEDKIEVLGVEMVPDNIIYIIDGKEVKAYEVNMLQPEKILTIEVLKGVSATSAYGERAKNGAIVVTTKQTNIKGAVNPIYVIDDVISTKEASDKLKPDEIQSVNVLGAENAKVLYGEKGKNGAVIIKTNKISPAKPVSVLPQIFPGNAVKAEKDNC